MILDRSDNGPWVWSVDHRLQLSVPVRCCAREVKKETEWDSHAITVASPHDNLFGGYVTWTKSNTLDIFLHLLPVKRPKKK